MQIQQLFESSASATAPADGSLPDISLRPDSAASTHRVKTAPVTRSMSTSSAPAVVAKITFPMTPIQALEKYKRVLTPFEQDEILNFPQVYFLGPLAKKIQAGDGKGPNYGYDDDKGRYKLVKNDHIGYRFEVLKGLGKGSFGDVVRTYDHKTQQQFALKIIRNERRFHKQGQIEIKILEHLRKEDKHNAHNVIHISEWFIFRDHICITFELLHGDLYSALKNDGFRGFSMVQVKTFAFEMLSALRMLRRNRIIHCDLKPENILLCKKDSLDIKVIDFGSACYDTQRVHTYIQSRFYRSPEVILGATYGMPIDMWSLGCILVELLTGQPLFPGHDEKEQLLYQMELLGLPSPSLMEKSKRLSIFFDGDGQPRVLTDHKGRRRLPETRTLSRALGRSEPEFEDFVLKCLRWDPDERITPKDALKHPFMASMLAASRMRRSISEGTAGATVRGSRLSGAHSPEALAEDAENGMQSLSLNSTVASATLGGPFGGYALPPGPTYVLPPVQLHSGTSSGGAGGGAASASTGIPAALLPRRPSATRMTADQQAHADRMRAASAAKEPERRRSSVSREKAPQ